jgi:DNA helicase II / ATP-dependent DNA helicase PcrA
VPNLSPAQSRVVGHPGGPLLVVAGPGTGKTTVLVERFARLVADGAHPDSVLALVAAPAAARRLRALLEDAIDGAYEELAVHTVHDLCARILHDEALEAGLDPFVVPLGRADRLAMLLEHLDDLPLREHDLGGSPAALMSRVVARIDRLKEDRVDAEHFAA